MTFTPKRLASSCSLRNTWRSFLKHFSERWDVTAFPSNLFPVFYSDCLTDRDEDMLKHAKAGLMFSFSTFAGGRGDEDHEFYITLIIKRDENIYDSLAMDLVDAVIDVFEDDYIPLYNFYTEDGVEIRETASPTGDDFPLFPIFTRVDLDEAFADNEIFKVLHIYIDVASSRSTRTIDLRR